MTTYNYLKGKKRNWKVIMAIIIIITIFIIVVIAVTIEWGPTQPPTPVPSPTPISTLTPTPVPTPTEVPTEVKSKIESTIGEFIYLAGLPIPLINASSWWQVKPATEEIAIAEIVSRGSILKIPIDKPYEFESFILREKLDQQSFEEFVVPYGDFLEDLIAPGDFLVEAEWYSTSPFTSLGIWTATGEYKYDSSMHWQLLFKAGSPKLSHSSSISFHWTILEAYFALGLGEVKALEMTVYVEAQGNGQTILDHNWGWRKKHADFPVVITKEDVKMEILSEQGIEYVKFTFDFEAATGIVTQWVSLRLSTEGRRMWIYLYADETTMKWGPPSS